MGRPSDWVREVTGRAPMRSPGHPGHQRVIEHAYCDEIARGDLPTECAVAVGVSPVAGTRWFRGAGGMSPYSWSPPALPELRRVCCRLQTPLGGEYLASPLVSGRPGQPQGAGSEVQCRPFLCGRPGRISTSSVITMTVSASEHPVTVPELVTSPETAGSPGSVTRQSTWVVVSRRGRSRKLGVC